MSFNHENPHDRFNNRNSQKKVRNLCDISIKPRRSAHRQDETKKRDGDKKYYIAHPTTPLVQEPVSPHDDITVPESAPSLEAGVLVLLGRKAGGNSASVPCHPPVGDATFSQSDSVASDGFVIVIGLFF